MHAFSQWDGNDNCCCGKEEGCSLELGTPVLLLLLTLVSMEIIGMSDQGLRRFFGNYLVSLHVTNEEVKSTNYLMQREGRVE